jgi:hypothetical protein
MACFATAKPFAHWQRAVDTVNSGHGKELPPSDQDWFYVRCAAIAPPHLHEGDWEPPSSTKRRMAINTFQLVSAVSKRSTARRKTVACAL